MVDETDQYMQDWVGSVVKAADVSFAAPSAQKGRGVSVYLLEMVQSPPPSTGRRPPLQLNLRYLLTAWSDKPRDAHEILGQLLFAAMDKKEFQVEMEPVPIAMWSAFGVPPQPSFVVRVPLRQERPETLAKPVRIPIIKTTPFIGMYGVVLGPDDIPISGSRIEIPSLNLSTNTDPKGRFHFPGVPAEGTKQFLVKARGRELSVSSEKNYPNSSEPLVIHFNLLEA
jgi:hypothetical protein